MKKIFTLLLSILAVSLVIAQERPEGEFAKVTTAPEIDGVVDEVWAEATVYNIDKPYRQEVPTLGEVGENTWQGVWVEGEGVYILLKVTDDAFYPHYAAGAAVGDNWQYDKPEIYFDVNFILEDGKGAGTDGTGNGSGHYQIAPGFTDGSNDGTPFTQDNGVIYAFMVDGTNYIGEYFVPFTLLKDADGNEVAKSDPIGFDVTLIDRDPDDTDRRRMQWANIGAKDENWSNMDDAGYVTFEGAEPAIDITSITIEGPAEITADNGTAQFTATITPTDATQPYKWELTNGTGSAKISNQGLLTAVKNGTVTVKAVSADNFTSSNEITVTISNQVVTHFESSYILDGDFTEGTGTTPSSVWRGGALVENGVLTITNPTAGVNPWDYTISQTLNIPQEMKDSSFVLQFKAWADEPRVFDVDIENVGGDYIRFGDSPDATALEGHSQWHLDLTTEPTVYKLNITNFSRMSELPQVFNLFAGMATPKVYVDSIFLVTKGDFVLKADQLNNSISRVYPNPVGNGHTLYIELSEINSKVAIYNSVGQKLMEGTVAGKLVKFDVSALRQGLYFVKTSDGSVQKFIK